MLNIKGFLNSLRKTSHISDSILRFGCILASFIMLMAISLAVKSGYNYDRQMLHYYMAETACYIFFLTTSGSILFEYMLSKRKNAE